MKWEKVYIFISSTFNDMHAERDYLIKRVFPELRLWCSERKLKLIDIDLRWGVSEKDATENKRVVDVCLNNVDKCRPFLLCFLGQRRGWIPGMTDINPHTLESFPILADYLGKNSITELEIIHGLLHPLNGQESSMRHAFFFQRNSDYLDTIEDESLKQVFQREIVFSDSKEDEFELFKESLKHNYQANTYDAVWNPEKSRLEHFQVNDAPLAETVLSQLKEAIQKEFPEHFISTEALDELETELNRQDTFLFTASDSYIPRVNEEQKILDYFSGNQSKPYIMTANAGTGKTSLLAHLIQTSQIPNHVFYRFIGTSSASSDTADTLYLLLDEISRAGYLSREILEKEKSNILLAFPELLFKITAKCSIVLDAVDQWNHLSTSSFRWLPASLPENIKLLISFKTNGNEVLLQYLHGKGHQLSVLNGMTSDREKAALIQEYLSQFLKDIDETQIAHLLSLPGSDNPLYLKIVLGELRIHGSFDTLWDMLNSDFGTTPQEAFQTVLARLEKEVFGENIAPAPFVKYILGTLGQATESIIVDEFSSICRDLIEGCKSLSKEEIMDAVYGLVRHLSAYLVIDGNRVNFLYDSFRQAVNERYQSSYTEFHSILAMIYSEYCYKNGGATYDVTESSLLTNSIYHATKCSENWAESLLTDPYFVYALLTKTSARRVASIYRTVNETYSTPSFEEIAKLLNKLSVKLDWGPNTLFYELSSKLGNTNPIVKTLCRKASKVMNLEFYYPIKEEHSSSFSPERALNLYSSDRSLDLISSFVSGDYLVYVKGNEILLQNIETEEFERHIKLQYNAYRSYADDNYLYVLYPKMNDLKDEGVEIFTLPDMNSVFFSDSAPVLEKDFSWRLVCYGCNGICYKYAVINNADYPELYVYNMNTNQLQIHSTYAEELPRKEDYSSLDVSFCGEYMMERSALHQLIRLWHLPTGKLILEIPAQPGRLISAENDLLWLVTIDYSARQMTCYIFKKMADSTVSQIQQFSRIDKQVLQLKEIWANRGCLCMFFKSGAFWVLNQKGEFKGSQKLNLNLNSYFSDRTIRSPFLKEMGPYLLRLGENQLQLYDYSALFSSLSDKLELEKNKESYAIMLNEHKVSMLGRHCQNLNLYGLRIENEQDYSTFNYHTGNSYNFRNLSCVLGTFRNDSLFAVQMLDLYSLKVIFRLVEDLPENVSCLENAFFKDGILGVIFRNKETMERPIKNSWEEVITETCNSYVILYYDIQNRFKLIDTWMPDLYEIYSTFSIHTAKDGTVYLIFLKANINEDYSEIRIYNALEKELVFSYRYGHVKDSIVDKGCIFIIDDIPYFSISERNMALSYDIDFNWEELHTKKHYMAVDPKTGTICDHYLGLEKRCGCDKEHLYLYSDDYKKEILIYSLKEKRIIKTLKTQTSKFCYCIFKNGVDLLAVYSGGICEVYDAATYKFKYRQILSFDLKGIYRWEEGNLLFINRDNGNYSIFKKKSIKEL